MTRSGTTIHGALVKRAEVPQFVQEMYHRKWRSLEVKHGPVTVGAIGNRVAGRGRVWWAERSA